MIEIPKLSRTSPLWKVLAMVLAWGGWLLALLQWLKDNPPPT